MKNIIKQAFFVIVSLLFVTSCSERTNDVYPEITIGKEATSLSEVSLNKETTKNIILSGGNGKYSVNVHDSKIASAEVSYDTLKIKGILEGETYATITSHNKKVRLGIKVVSPDISISQEVIRLYPQDDARFITLSGGGDIINLDINDPNQIMEVKFNGSSNIIEIRAIYEGDATIVAKSANVPDRTLKVEIRSEGEAEKAGVYIATSKSLYNLFPSKMIAHRKGAGVWLAGSTHPYGYYQSYTTRKAIHISPVVNPTAGENVEVEIKGYPDKLSDNISDGKHSLYVDEVREKTVVLRGRGYRLVIPYDK